MFTCRALRLLTHCPVAAAMHLQYTTFLSKSGCVVFDERILLEFTPEVTWLYDKSKDLSQPVLVKGWELTVQSVVDSYT